MPGNGSAAKRHRQSESHRQKNRVIRSRIHSVKRTLLEAVDSKNLELASSSYREVAKLIDSAKSKGVYHKNTANRKKSRLHKMLNSMSADT